MKRWRVRALDRDYGDDQSAHFISVFYAVVCIFGSPAGVTRTCLCLFRGARALGADLAVDFRKESYSDVVQDFSAVVDTLGREKEGPQDMLKEARGAEYVSLQPSILKVN